MPYTSPNSIQRRRAMAQQMAGQRQGRGKGSGLAHILRNLGAYQGGRFAAADEAANSALKQKEMAQLLRAVTNDPESVRMQELSDLSVLKGTDVAGTGEGAYTHPEVQAMELQRQIGQQATQGAQSHDMAKILAQGKQSRQTEELKQKAPYTLGSLAERRGPNGELIATNRNVRPPSSSGGGGVPPYQFIGSGEGLLKGNRFTGEIAQALLAGNPDPVMRDVYDAPTRAKVAGATTTATAEAEKAFTMKGGLTLIEDARAVLSGEATGTEPTGSGAGSLVDSAAGFFGGSPDGATEAATLKTIGGWLTSKVPRMEGPQSDFDRQYYQEMAAMVGDASIPVDRRLASLDELKKVMEKYSHLNQSSVRDQADAILGL